MKTKAIHKTDFTPSVDNGQTEKDLPKDSLAADTKLPWQDIPIPSSWQLTPMGLYRETKARDGEIQTELTSSPIWVSAIAYGNQKDNWTAVIEFLDIDGHQHKFPCGRDRFYDKGNSLVSDLAGFGLRIQSRQEKQLLQYLIDCSPAARLRAVDKLGWLDSDKLVYVRQDGTIGNITANGKTVCVIYKPERHVTKSQSTNGSLEDWQTNIASKAGNEDMFLFALCMAFAAPLLKAAQMDSFGINFFGGTTKGKTTGAQIAASISGNGSDPAAAPESSYIKRWNSTANGLEGLAAEHNDSVLPLDELGSCGVKEFGYVTYNLFGGLGKTAMTADRQLKKQRQWRLIVLSTGEISAQEKLEQSEKKAKGGQLLRFIDIPFQLSDRITAEAIDKLKSACGQYYGIAGKTYIEYLVDGYSDFNALTTDIRARTDIAFKVLQQSTNKKLSAEQARCAKRFALALVGGGLAKSANILQCANEKIQSAIITVFQAWLTSEPSITESMRGVAAVADFIFKNQDSRFKPYPTTGDALNRNNLAGYYDKANGVFYLSREAMKEATTGFNQVSVCKSLEELGFLEREDDEHLTKKITVDGVRQHFYAVSETILEFSLSDLTGTTGTAGVKHNG